MGSPPGRHPDLPILLEQTSRGWKWPSMRGRREQSRAVGKAGSRRTRRSAPNKTLTLRTAPSGSIKRAPFSAVGVERQADRERHSRRVSSKGPFGWPAPGLHTGAYLSNRVGEASSSVRSVGAGVEGLVSLHAVQAYRSTNRPGSTAGSSLRLAQPSAGAEGRPRDVGDRGSLLL